MVLALSLWLAAAPTLGERLSADVWCQPILGVKTDRMNCMVFERSGTWRFVRMNSKVEDEVLLSGVGKWKAASVKWVTRPIPGVLIDGVPYVKKAK